MHRYSRIMIADNERIIEIDRYYVTVSAFYSKILNFSKETG